MSEKNSSQHFVRESARSQPEPILDSNQRPLRVKRKVRHFYDSAARYGIAVGGVAVIATMLVIFVFLLAEVQPLFRSASVISKTDFSSEVLDERAALHMAMDEQGRSMVRISEQGTAVFIDTESGMTTASINLPMPAGESISLFAFDSEETGLFAYSSNSGSVYVAQYLWETEFSINGALETTPGISYPFGEAALIDANEDTVHSLAISRTQEEFLLVAGGRGGDLKTVRAALPRNLFSDFTDTAVEPLLHRMDVNLGFSQVDRLFIGGDRRLLYAVSNLGELRVVNLKTLIESGESEILTVAQLVPTGTELGPIHFLSGGLSLLVADSRGLVSQWFVVRADGKVRMESVRTFAAADTKVIALAAEQRRKNFVTLGESGSLTLFNVTSGKRALSGATLSSRALAIAIAPRGDVLMAELDGGSFERWLLDNPHPEVSVSALWRKIWYESYPAPDYVWQSSAASNDYEPKYSLMPLSFGTFKAAFYAMLLAAPLAVCGAIYTGFFMAPALRGKVKPLIELMEALPTVVLGFLAGLWLAPFVEIHLLGVLSLLVIFPVGTLLFSFLWFQLPKQLRFLVPEGWEAVLLTPVILLLGWICLALSNPLESLLFAGDLRQWMSTELGISYAQRNAMVVGIAMGFAVIPTIYSIAEDAIFTVPRHLSDGSLALGATAWQSLYHVVLPTASPGIFSALMIGLGRAVGETMIILMATGNTPIMDVNVFEGMRTLAATIAIEVPESEVSSTHYRILFLAATVLFMFTFVVNTVAEVVRQQLRKKYSSI